ncbi:MAG: MFS transporter [Fibrobacteria bacterium]|nr:MFS transporter [Fibrobacteria bacterium]
MNNQKKEIWGWVLYDWANSAFATTVLAGFFPVFFKQYWSAGADVNTSTALLGLGNSLASLLVAIMAPVLGALADKCQAQKKFLIFFTYLGVLMTAGLFLVEKGDWELAIIIYALGNIGFFGAIIFYDSLLPRISSRENLDMVSAFGYAMGYLGGGILFLINVIMTLKPGLFGLADAGEAVRYSFLSVAVWWGGFALFTFIWIKDVQTKKEEIGLLQLIVMSMKDVIDTIKKIRGNRTILIFLLAYWFYIDGVDTIIRMAVDYGMSLGFATTDLISALLITQFVGFPSALLFGKLGERWDVRKAIFLALGIYVIITLGGAFMTNKREFYLLAAVVGMVQGGIQALSRSFYSRLIPAEESAKFFGFYNMLGKSAAIIGPLLIGITGLLVKRIAMPSHPTTEQITLVGHFASRCSIASVLLLFITGMVLFYFVKAEEKTV